MPVTALFLEASIEVKKNKAVFDLSKIYLPLNKLSRRAFFLTYLACQTPLDHLFSVDSIAYSDAKVVLEWKVMAQRLSRVSLAAVFGYSDCWVLIWLGLVGWQVFWNAPPVS